jgi:hypothetical protein
MALMNDYALMNNYTLDAVRRSDEWLDGECGPAYKAQPLAQTWARVCKAIEEGGEVVSELIVTTGQNPRKPATGSRHQVCAELADRAWAAILAIQHLTKDTAKTDSYVASGLAKVLSRARDAGY